jgi:S-formylglutathione hydrolase
MKTVSEVQCFSGRQGYYQHRSDVLDCDMQFSVFVPPQAQTHNLPVVTYLSGLTCTADNVTSKSGFQRIAAELGLIIVAPDTSPRGDHVPDEDSWDFASGAGFYVDATQEPWAHHYQMYSYITAELPALIEKNFPVDMARQGITGHSMGGHGALTIALKNPETYQSVSAFAPICAPSQCPWGEKALGNYLGHNEADWQAYDATLLMQSRTDRNYFPEILIDQGLNDNFLQEQLKPQLFADACQQVNQKLNFRQHAGYDHSYYFIASFIEDHLRHHHAILTAV